MEPDCLILSYPKFNHYPFSQNERRFIPYYPRKRISSMLTDLILYPSIKDILVRVIV